MSVVIETTVGDITVDLFINERPQTCKNFLKLCKIKYYNFCLFHSIQANFIAQTGDPTETGTGGESIFGVVNGKEQRYYEGEKMPKIKHCKAGLMSMVNCGENMLGSQFFITLSDDLQSLEEHCVFGEVVEGMEVLVKLNDAICDSQFRPYQDIRITHTVILDDPYDDIPGLVVPDSSPDISKLPEPNGRIGADEKINDEEGLTASQLEELKAEREAKARATILEIVGDLPDAEIAPPENVLFVCKLNPVTSDDDLEIIFSRFGKIKSCEVIRDKTTGDSLQYAFIEFEDQRSCEQAYLKMDNVLIDDRRIHVDFSQSVSKIRWRGKGRGVVYSDKNGERPYTGKYDKEVFKGMPKYSEKDTSRSKPKGEEKKDIERSKKDNAENDNHRHRSKDDYKRRNDSRHKDDNYEYDSKKRREDKKRKDSDRYSSSRRNDDRNRNRRRTHDKRYEDEDHYYRDDSRKKEDHRKKDTREDRGKERDSRRR